MSQSSEGDKSLVNKYSRQFRLDASTSSVGTGVGFETNTEESGPVVELTERGVKDAVEKTRIRLKDFALKYYGGEVTAENQKLIDSIAQDVNTGLDLLRKKDEVGLRQNPDAVSGLETIIIGDGSRPMYLIENDRVDFESAVDLVLTNGNPRWQLAIEDAQRQGGLSEVVPSVGVLRSRHNRKKFYGTAFLIAADLIMTNKHVWEAIRRDHGEHYGEVVVDFQYEMRNQTATNLRLLETVVFLGPGDPIMPDIDVALFSLNSSDGFEQQPFDIHAGKWLPQQDAMAVFVIGHPEIPEKKSKIEKFLSGTSYVKRLSPGYARHSRGTPVYHSASTLEANSGSIVVSPEFSPRIAIGIHYGFGDLQVDGNDKSQGQVSNKAHAISEILGQKSTQESTALGRTLRQTLDEFGANLVSDDL
jgi:hypothetical protein